MATPTSGTTPPPGLSNEPVSNHIDISNSVIKSPDESIIGSPLKKQRASVAGIEDETMRKRLGLGFTGGFGDVLGKAEAAQTLKKNDENDDEVL
jgi:hypothetical protein